MPKPCQTKKVLEWPALPTWMDLRSPVDQIPWGRWRYALNLWCAEPGKWSRRPGWRKFGHDLRMADNGDLHSRPVTDDSPITSLFSHQARAGYRRLFAGTSTHVYSQHFDGRWRAISELTSGNRIEFASINDVILFTNDASAPRYHLLDEAAAEDGWADRDIPELATIGLTRAAVCFSWRGVAFLADVEMDGVRCGNRVVWCDENDILAWEPSAERISGFQDLSPGEIVLAARPLADALFIFTTHGIWRMTYVGGDTAFGFQQIYYSKEREACLVGRRAIAVWGARAMYWSTDGPRIFDPFSIQPEKPEWAWRGAPAFEYDDCQEISACYYQPPNEIWFSSPQTTITFNVEDLTTSVIDHGFRELLVTQIDTSLSLYEWMEQTLGCSSASIDAIWPQVNEDPRPTVSGSTKDIDVLCLQEDFFPRCENCASPEKLVMVSAGDECIKEYDHDYYARETWSSSGTTYTDAGYPCKLITGCLNFGDSSFWKRVSEVVLEFTAPVTDTQRTIALSIASSSSPHEVLDSTGCEAKTFSFSAKSVGCPTAGDGSTLPNIRPLRWVTMVEGRFLTLSFEMPSVTGGAFTLSRMTTTVMRSPNTTA